MGADLQSALSTMKSKNRFKKLTFYLETCESGSMFEGMDIEGVYALSASSPSESSWGTYCGSDAMVDGKSIGSCLGDLFSSLRSCTQMTATNTTPCAMAPALPTT